MRELKILNKKEIKKILVKIKEQWDVDFEVDYGVLLSPKNKLYLVGREMSEIDLSKIRVNNLGIYFGEITKYDELRLSIEGSQMIGKDVKKNVLELDKEQARDWFKGNDIDFEGSSKGFVILKHEGDFIGSGKHTRDKILNYVPKARRINLFT